MVNLSLPKLDALVKISDRYQIPISMTIPIQIPITLCIDLKSTNLFKRM